MNGSSQKQFFFLKALLLVSEYEMTIILKYFRFFGFFLAFLAFFAFLGCQNQRTQNLINKFSFLGPETNSVPQQLIHTIVQSQNACHYVFWVIYLSEKSHDMAMFAKKPLKNALFPTLLLNLAILPSKNNFLGFLTPDSNSPQFFAYSHHISMILCDRLDFDHFGTQMIP